MSRLRVESLKSTEEIENENLGHLGTNRGVISKRNESSTSFQTLLRTKINLAVRKSEDNGTANPFKERNRTQRQSTKTAQAFPQRGVFAS